MIKQFEFTLADYRTPYAAFCVSLSALMVLSVASGAPIAVLFAQMAALPLIFSTIALSWQITVLPLLFALVGLGIISKYIMLTYLLAIGMPALLLGYLTLFKQEFKVELKSTPKSAPRFADVVYVNSSSFILSILALYAVSVASNLVILFAMPVENLYAKLSPIFTQMETAAALPAPLIELLKNDEMRNSFMQAIPIAALILWFCTTVMCFYVAARLAKYFKLLNRPWPHFVREYELSTVIILCTVAALLCMFLPYPFGYIAEFAVSIFMILWIFAGLCTVHHFARSFNMPILFLSLFYIGLIIFGWLFIFVALFGVLDALFGFRTKRHLNTPTPL